MASLGRSCGGRHRQSKRVSHAEDALKETDGGAELRRRRERPKRLCIDPSNEVAFNSQTDDLYEFDPQSVLSSLWTRRAPRPFPAARSMAALAEAKLSDKRSETTPDAAAVKHDSVMPMLRRFIESLESDESTKPCSGSPLQMAPSLPSVSGSVTNDCYQDASKGTLVGSASDAGANKIIAGKGSIAVAGTNVPSVGIVSIDPLDNTASTMLSTGQRARYKVYLNEASKQGKYPLINSTPQGREFRSLRDAVREERKAYCQALLQFRQKNVDRFLIGFKVPCPASRFVETGSQLVTKYRKRVRSCHLVRSRPAELYSSCVQAISLHEFVSNIGENAVVAPDDKKTTTSRDFGAVFDESYFATDVVDTVNLGRNVCQLTKEQITSLCKEETLKPHSGPLSDGVCLLCEDSTAKRLALKHEASIVLTFEAMVELLRRPGHNSTRWSIPLLQARCDSSSVEGSKNCSRDILILEDPFPVQSTTREWLTNGFTESLKSMLRASTCPNLACSNEDSVETSPSIQYVYSLLSLPTPYHSSHSGRFNAPLKVLVRTINELFDETNCPVRLRLNLEYFPERGMEIPTAHERAVWILEKAIQPNCRVLFSRVDPNTAQIIEVEEKSVAHALACEDLRGKDCTGFDPSLHFDAFSTVMRGIGNLGEDGRYILCLPGRGLPKTSAATSVTVHKECNEQTVKSAIAISLEEELSVADSVSTSMAFLMSCYRAWQWTSDRLPYTFPAQ